MTVSVIVHAVLTHVMGSVIFVCALCGHFSRALRALAASNADIVGPSDSFLVGFETGQFYRSKILLSSSTLDPSFIQLVNYNYTTLDIYLPLLLLPSSSTLSISYVSLMSTLLTVALRSW